MEKLRKVKKPKKSYPQAIAEGNYLREGGFRNPPEEIKRVRADMENTAAEDVWDKKLPVGKTKGPKKPTSAAKKAIGIIKDEAKESVNQTKRGIQATKKAYKSAKSWAKKQG